MNSYFPSFLEPTFDAVVLDQLESSIAVLDPVGRMLWVNRHWQERAREEGVTSLVDEPRVYFDGITPSLRAFYETVFAQALATGKVFDQIYDCSSPTARRVFHGRVLPIVGEGLLVEHSRVVDIPVDGFTDEAWSGTYAQADGMIRQCGHCKRVHGPTPHAWDWMSAWAAPPAITSHVICPLCECFFWGGKGSGK